MASPYETPTHPFTPEIESLREAYVPEMAREITPVELLSQEAQLDAVINRLGIIVRKVIYLKETTVQLVHV